MAVTRNEIEARFKWRLEDLFASDEIWERSFSEWKAAVGALPALKGTLSESGGAPALKQAMDRANEASLLGERLYVYAHMRRDENNADAHYQDMTDRAMQGMVELETAVSFITPELLRLPEEALAAFAREPSLRDNWHRLRDILRQRPHVLDEAGERLLAMVGEVMAAPKNIFNMLDYADLTFPGVNTPEGEKELSHGNFIVFMESPDRAVRRDAFEKLYATYRSLENTFAAAYASSVKADVFTARARGYASSLEAALFPDHIPAAVYENLIETTHGYLPALDNYLKLRETALGAPLEMYDLYTPMLPRAEFTVPFQEAKALVCDGLAALGGEYGGLLREAFDGGWMDVFENRGKTSGAYCWGAYGTHPFVLLNYQPNINGVFTIAHELGHAMHSCLSDRAQPFATAQYTIFVAEVASTVNEILLTRHLLATESDRQKRMYLLNHFLEQFRTTLFRQVMFAEFEKRSHELCEAGEALTAQRLCEEYLALNARYYGRNVSVTPPIAMEWARISHFYNAFYVYKYATGFSAACAIAGDILRTGDPGRYLTFLSGGGSDYPLELLKIAGVDLSSPAPVAAALDTFTETLARLQALMEQEEEQA